APGRALAPPPARDPLEQILEVAQRVSERGPVLEVHGAPDALGDTRRGAAPRPLAHRLVPGLHEVHAAAEERGQRGAEEEMVERPARPALDPVPLLGVDHVAGPGAQPPAGARVHHHDARATEVAAVAPARARDLAVGGEGELADDRARGGAAPAAGV